MCSVLCKNNECLTLCTGGDGLSILLNQHHCRVKALSVVPGAHVVFSASSDGSVRVWKTTEKPVKPDGQV